MNTENAITNAVGLNYTNQKKKGDRE